MSNIVDFCRKSSRNFLKILKIVENRQNSSKIINFQRLQRNSLKNVISDASSRMTSFDVFWRQSMTAFDARRRSMAKIDELRHLTSNDVICTRRSHHYHCHIFYARIFHLKNNRLNLFHNKNIWKFTYCNN